MMLFAQISDTHIAAQGKKTYNIAPMAENLERCVEHINQLSPRPEFVIVTGDITQDGREEEAECAESILGKLHIPFFILPGNHDNRKMLRSAFDKKACPCSSNDFINYVIEGYDVRFICIDSIVPGGPGGEICEQRAKWLDEQLAEAGAWPTVIFMHRPPVKLGVSETDIDGFVGAELLGEIVGRYPNVIRIACGHVHLSANTVWSGTAVSTAPSPGMELVLDLTMEHESEFVLSPPCYQLHYWTSQQNLVSYDVVVRYNARAYRFEEYNDKDIR